MDSVKPANSSNLAGKLRGLTKILRLRTAGVAPDDKIKKSKEDDHIDDEELKNRVALEAVLAKVFASLSSVKAGYAQLQIAQSPYDPEGIQVADGIVVTELKRLSELKQCYLKKQIDPSPGDTHLLAEHEEQKNLLKTYEIVGKKIESQLKIKDSEIEFLKEKVEECFKENRLVEKRLSSNGSLAVFDGLHLSGLNPTHFNSVLKHAIKSIRSFVKLMINGMESSGWNIDAAASSIDPSVVYSKMKHKCFGFESFVCREMFENFQYPQFALQNEAFVDGKQRQQHFFYEFMKMKSLKPKSLFSRNSPSQLFPKFCRDKYLRLIHPKMEISVFGNINQRDTVSAGKYPDTAFFTAFSEMARRIWLLHCLAFSFETEASIFQVRKGSRFSEVYMESVTEDAFLSGGNVQVSLTVVPGFKIGQTVLQSQVYLSTR